MGKRLTGLVIGVAIIIGGIALYRYAGTSQNRAAEFAEAQRVSADEVVEGFVAVEGTVVANETLPCPFGGGDCAFVTTSSEEYVSTQKEVCGELEDDTVIIQYEGEQCTGSGETESCESCYLVEEYEWNVLDSDTSRVALTLGSYSISNSTGAEFDGSHTETVYDVPESETDPYIGDLRTVVTYQPLANIRFVSGIANASGDIAAGGKDQPLRISTKTIEAISADLETQDNSMKWVLRVLGIVMVLIGFGSIGKSFSMKNTAVGKAMDTVKDMTNMK